jgi:hypothetical protein
MIMSDLRAWLATRLFRLGGWLLGCDVEIKHEINTNVR